MVRRAYEENQSRDVRYAGYVGCGALAGQHMPSVIRIGLYREVRVFSAAKSARF